MILETHRTETRHVPKGQAALYATGSDFCRIFKDDMKNLYLLSLLLTADPEKAEQCFVSGLDDCAAGNQIFREWTRSWARRAIIKNAIRLIAPQPAVANQDSTPSAAKAMNHHPPSGLRAELAALFHLQPFERFAFVTSVLEGYSDRDCALLLGCTRDSLVAARSQALQQVAQPVDPENQERTEPGFTIDTLHSNRNSIVGLAIPPCAATPA